MVDPGELESLTSTSTGIKAKAYTAMRYTADGE
jgi:hypothetical protein